MKKNTLLLIVLCLFLALSQINAQSEEILDVAVYNRSVDLGSTGWVLLSAGDPQTALRNFNDAIKLNKNAADNFVGRANAYLKLAKYDSAELDVLMAMQLAEGQADIHFLAGNVYYKIGDFFKAIRHYDIAIDLNDDAEVPVSLVNIYFNRGNAHLSAELYRSAINDFTKVIDLDDSLANAYHNRGIAYRNVSNTADACTDFQKAMVLGSDRSQKFVDIDCR